MTRETRTVLTLKDSANTSPKPSVIRQEWIANFGSARAKATVSQGYPEARIYREERTAVTLADLGVLPWFARGAELQSKPKKKGSPGTAALDFERTLKDALGEYQSEGATKLTLIHVAREHLGRLFEHYGARADAEDACLDPALDECAWREGEALLVEDLFPFAEPIILPIPKRLPKVQAGAAR